MKILERDILLTIEDVREDSALREKYILIVQWTRVPIMKLLDKNGATLIKIKASVKMIKIGHIAKKFLITIELE